MTKIVIADSDNINDIVTLRVEMQIEDWNKTLGKDFSCYSDEFAQITNKHLTERLNKSIFFAIFLFFSLTFRFKRNIIRVSNDKHQ